MDLDVPLFWLSLLLPAGGLLRAAGPGWRLVCGGLLLAALAAGTLTPGPFASGSFASGLAAPGVAAGLVIALWALLIALPSLLARGAALAVARQEYGQAYRFSLGVCLLHPLDGWPGQVALFRALALLRMGRWDLAKPRLERLAGGRVPGGGVHGVNRLSALSYLCAWSHDWRPLTETPPPPAHDILAAIMRIRALGESGRTEEMLAQYAAVGPLLEHHPYRALALLPVFAFSGRPGGVATLARTALPLLPAETKTLWLATAQLAAGGAEAERARAALEGLLHSPLMDIRHLAAIRLASPPPVAGPPAPEIAALLDRAETDFLRVPPPRDRITWRRGPVTLGVLGVLLAVFALEVAQGGSEDNAVLFRMGGLWPPAVLRNGEWWRLAAAPFLHAGPVHLGFNLVALLFLGFAAETMFGRVRFLVLYGLTALGSTAGVLALMHFGWTAPGLLIGASGALMGLAGAIAAALVVRPRGEPEAGGGRQFWGIVLLLAVQSGMDLTTPHVSFSAHASGFVLGFLLGLLPAFRRGARLPALPAPRPSPAAAGPTGRPMGGPVGGRPVGGRPVGGRPVGGRPVGGRRTLGIYVVIGLVFGTALWSRIRKSPLSGARPAPRPTPALTPAVLAGIRRLHFLFFDGEAGTPLVDPEAPFGSRDALADLADLAGRDGDARALYAAIMANLPAFCARARLTPGRYALTPARVAAINATLPRDVPPAARDGMFVFTREHAVLIPVLRWQTMDGDFSWDMAIDQGHLPPSPGNAWPVALVTPKRPYGDFTFFEADMARALGIPHGKNARGEAELPKALIDRLYRLHGEMTAAVQVFVQRATLH